MLQLLGAGCIAFVCFALWIAAEGLCPMLLLRPMLLLLLAESARVRYRA
jgi:hypothetical protein